MKRMIIALSAVLCILLTGCASKNGRLIQRPDPNIKVSAEEFQKEMDYSFSVPQGAQEITYVIDTETHRGYMGFYLDGVLWNAKAEHVDAYEDILHTNLDEYMVETTSELDSEQVLQIHDADPEIHYYKHHYDNIDDTYQLTAMWYLEDEGVMVALDSYSETPIHTMPVEVFG